jgi:hypothetical protein
VSLANCASLVLGVTSVSSRESQSLLLQLNNNGIEANTNKINFFIFLSILDYATKMGQQRP